jgi:hypothetical protein
MRLQAAVIFLLAATSAASAQCPLGSFPTITSSGQTVCQSALGQTPTVGSQVCPPGSEWDYDSAGHRTCRSTDRNSRSNRNVDCPTCK